jgi:hypothetical protein
LESLELAANHYMQTTEPTAAGGLGFAQQHLRHARSPVFKEPFDLATR